MTAYENLLDLPDEIILEIFYKLLNGIVKPFKWESMNQIEKMENLEMLDAITNFMVTHKRILKITVGYFSKEFDRKHLVKSLLIDNLTIYNLYWFAKDDNYNVLTLIYNEFLKIKFKLNTDIKYSNDEKENQMIKQFEPLNLKTFYPCLLNLQEQSGEKFYDSVAAYDIKRCQNAKIIQITATDIKESFTLTRTKTANQKENIVSQGSSETASRPEVSRTVLALDITGNLCHVIYLELEGSRNSRRCRLISETIHMKRKTRFKVLERTDITERFKYRYNDTIKIVCAEDGRDVAIVSLKEGDFLRSIIFKYTCINEGPVVKYIPFKSRRVGHLKITAIGFSRNVNFQPCLMLGCFDGSLFRIKVNDNHMVKTLQIAAPNQCSLSTKFLKQGDLQILNDFYNSKRQITDLKIVEGSWSAYLATNYFGIIIVNYPFEYNLNPMIMEENLNPMIMEEKYKYINTIVLPNIYEIIKMRNVVNSNKISTTDKDELIKTTASYFGDGTIIEADKDQTVPVVTGQLYPGKYGVYSMHEIKQILPHQVFRNKILEKTTNDTDSDHFITGSSLENKTFNESSKIIALDSTDIFLFTLRHNPSLPNWSIFLIDMYLNFDCIKTFKCDLPNYTQILKFRCKRRFNLFNLKIEYEKQNGNKVDTETMFITLQVPNDIEQDERIKI